ncbi:MAG: DUF5106 domain-containing protein [Candidatus Cryptobacteroides sp.]
MKYIKIYNILTAAASAAVLFVGCAGSGGKGASAPQARPFPYVQVPGVVAAEQEAAVEYAAEHYWDALTDLKGEYACDSSLVRGVKKSDVEAAFANWLGLLSNQDISRSRKNMSLLYSKAEACEEADTASNVFETMKGLVEKYLYDPNSPLRNEDLYGVYAQRLSGCGRLPQWERDKYAREASLCALNSLGTPAADFEFSDRMGVTRHLYDIKADYTLLFFSNPGCKACKEIIEALTNVLSVSGLISTGRLAVVNVYIDEDLAAWYDYMPIYPKDWHNGYDPNGVIRADTLYNVRAIPSLYMLDKDKTVLAKDAPQENIFAFIENLGK